MFVSSRGSIRNCGRRWKAPLVEHVVPCDAKIQVTRFSSSTQHHRDVTVHETQSQPLPERDHQGNQSSKLNPQPVDGNAAVHMSSNSTKNQNKARTYSPSHTIFSGIQPTGVPHLGNYLGALRQWKHFQDEKAEPNVKKRRNHKLFYSIVDLHALTHTQSRSERLRLTRETFASLLAIGLDLKHSTVFVQSEVSAHSELMWILSTIASTGYLSRMTQWKTKLGLSEDATLDDMQARENLRLGLFSYPVLQAADILLYQTNLVPVGEDQLQHVEFARSLAGSFNSHYGCDKNTPLFRKPKALLSPAKRIMSLRDPTVKMSKSHPDPKSRILITDTPEEIHSKIKGALTDSVDGITYDREARPGVANLIEILMHVTQSPKSGVDIASDHKDDSMRAFKEHVTDEIIKAFTGFRKRFVELMAPGNQELDDTMVRGYMIANAKANATLTLVKEQIGLISSKRAVKSNARRSKYAEKNKPLVEDGQQHGVEVVQEQENSPVLPQQDQGVDRPIAS